MKNSWLVWNWRMESSEAFQQKEELIQKEEKTHSEKDKTLKEQRIEVENVQGTESSQMKLSVVEKSPRGPKVTVLLLYRRQMINPLV